MGRSLIETNIIDDILIANFKANALSADVFEQLNNILTDVENDKTCKGIIFTSDNDRLYLAGADLFEMEKIIDSRDEDKLRGIIETGQQTYNRIQNLNIPTVATIHGICLGLSYMLKQ